jgi:hypothetical protein
MILVVRPCDDGGMSFFRKQPPTSAPVTPEERPPAPVQAPALPPGQALFNGPVVDFGAIYHGSKLTTDELDRVARAEELLHALPTNAPQTREVVDATFRAFGVDRTKILSAANRQLEALEAFVRYSHEQTQNVLDANARRIAELEREIERCRQVAAQATTEGEERARSVNDVLIKVQRVLEFFGDHRRAASNDGLDEDTTLSKTDEEARAIKAPPVQSGKASQSTSVS